MLYSSMDALLRVLSFARTSAAKAAIVIAAIAVVSFGMPMFASAATCAIDTEANLIPNPCFEDDLVPVDGLPDLWVNNSAWTLETAAFTYPATEGVDGSKAVRVEVTAHVAGGDAKWFAEPYAFTVAGNTNYSYTSQYKSDVPTRVVVAEFDGTDWTYSEGLSGVIPSPAEWGTVVLEVKTKPSTQRISIYHLVDSVGFLTVDNTSLTVTTPLEVTDMVPNHSVEEASPSDPNLPRGWMQASYEINGSDITPVFEYVDGDGHGAGDRSVKVTISDFDTTDDADAKWVYAPQPIPVEDDKNYRFTAWYKTDTTPHVVAQFTMEGTTTPKYLGLQKPFPTGNSDDAWTEYATEFSAPAGATEVTVFFFLRSNGFVQTDDYRLDSSYSYPELDRALITLTFDDGASVNNNTMLPVLNGHGFKSTQCYMTEALDSIPAEIAAAHAFFDAGHEICAHTETHPFLTQLTAEQVEQELSGSKTFLETNVTDGAPVTSFATPFGDYNEVVNTQIASHFSLHRTVDEGYNSSDNIAGDGKYRLRVQNMNPNTTLAEFNAWVDKAIEDKTWLILVYHQILPTGSSAEAFDTFEPDFVAQMNSLKAKVNAAGDANAAVKTLRDAYAEAVGTTTPVVTHTITATSSANGTISPSGAVVVTAGADQAFTITPAIGYDVATLLVDGVSIATSTNYVFNAVSAAHTIEATFAAVVVPPVAACANGTDDDGDTLIDFPNDPGCTSADDTDETNVVVVGVDYSVLDARIGASQATIAAAVEGDAPGQYPVGLKAEIQLVLDGVIENRALAEAAETEENVAEIQTIIDQLVTLLDAAMDVFLASVNPAPADAPVAEGQSVVVDSTSSVAITLIATDTDPLTYSIVDGPTRGTLSGDAPNVTYTPNSGFVSGSDSFTFKANDGTSDSNIATVSITVTLSPTCDEGFHLEGGQCIADGPVSGCAIGTVFNATSGLCEMVPVDPVPPTTVYSCPEGSTLDGTSCVPAPVAPVAPTCPEGVAYDSETNLCADTSAPVCSTGTLNPDTDMCETSAEDPFPATESESCGPGFTLDGEVCVADPIAPTAPTCANGTVLEGGMCLPNPVPAQCPAGYHLEGTFCAVNVPTTPSGNNNNGGGGSGGGGSYSIRINSGDNETDSTNVTLNLRRAKATATKVWISNDSNFSSGDWQNYATRISWKLSSGAGDKTVYVRFGDSGEKVLSTKRDSIELTGEVLGASTEDPEEPPVPVDNTSGSACYLFTRDLYMGLSGDDVTALQEKLKALGYFTFPSATGYFGPLTWRAVVAYQTAQGITPAPGYVGPKTRAKLNECAMVSEK